MKSSQSSQPLAAWRALLVGGLALLGSSLLFALDAGPAFAANVSSSGYGFTQFEDLGAEVNTLTISQTAPGTIVFTDSTTPPMDADGPGGCSVVANVATCPGTSFSEVNLGGANDTATVANSLSSFSIQVNGDAGNDAIIGSVNGESLDGGVGNDTITAGSGNDSVEGGPFSLDGFPLGTTDDDTLTLGDGDDSGFGGAGTDTIDGGPGNDGGGFFGGGLSGGTGNDTITGGTGFDDLSGGTGIDTLRGNGDNDTLSDGDQQAFFGTPSSIDADIVDGGPGRDSLFSYANRSANVLVNLTASPAVDNGGEAGENDDVIDIEDVTTGGGNDTLTGNASDNVLDSGPGNDVLNGNAGNDTLSAAGFFFGGPGPSDDDTANGGDGADTVDGGPGVDALTGGPGDDTVTGGEGNDTSVAGDAGNDDVDAGDGNDAASGGDGSDEVSGSTGNDTLDGGAGNDAVLGDRGNDSVTGGGGQDELRGGQGDDSFNSQDTVPDEVGCGSGTDAVTNDAIDTVDGDCETLSTPRAPGPTGATGATGATGSTGAAGAAGAPGARGPGGPAGAQGRPGRDAVVTCKVGKAKKGKVKVSCSVKLASSASTKARTLRARLTRGGAVYATGSGPARGGAAKLRMQLRRRVTSGAYTLSVVGVDGRGKTNMTTKQQVTIR